MAQNRAEIRISKEATVTKKAWRKPEVKTLKAGAAETNKNVQLDDGDANGNFDNS